MVGSRFCELSTLPLVKADLNGEISVDITRPQSVADFFESHDFETVILFSAFTDVDAAEKQRGHKDGLCWQINVEGVKNIIDSCNKFKRKLVSISTDFVFDGTNGPYSEEDKTGPDLSQVSWYGITKIEAEDSIMNELTDFIIIRISYPYRAYFEPKDDFARQILNKFNQGSLYPMFNDQQITPTFIDDLAPAIAILIKQQESGIFHLASPKVTCPYDFACFLLDVFGHDPTKVQKASLKDFLKDPTKTPRPVKGGMKVEKITRVGFRPTNWQDGLKIIYTQSQGQLI